MKTIPIIPKNSLNLIAIFGSRGSPSDIKAIEVSMEETARIFKNFLVIIYFDIN